MLPMPMAIIDSIVNIIYPPICAGCGRIHHSHRENNINICNECYFGIKRHSPPFCIKCGRGLSEIININQGICPSCLNRQYYFDEAWSICAYEGIMKDIIHKFKYNQKIQYKNIFYDLFSEFIGAFNILKDIDLIVPIPLHPTRLREREYNQSQILASIVSQIINKPVDSRVLIRLRNTKPQINLNEEKRIKNIGGCFSVKPNSNIEAKTILLIDDVLTTGITLSESAKVIKELQPKRITVLALAS